MSWPSGRGPFSAPTVRASPLRPATSSSSAGPYRYVRHPLYSGILLLSLALAIWFGNLTGVATFAVLFAVFWLRGRQEEALLTRHFPVAYPAYERRTKALIPLVF